MTPLPTQAPSTPKDSMPSFDDRTYMNLLVEPGISREPVTATHRLAYLGESCSVALLGHEDFPEQLGYSSANNSIPISNRLEKLDRIEVEILIRKGALMLPPKSLCDDLVDSYFEWIHPVVPILNKARFMRQYCDRNNPPSLLLLQAVILAASRVSNNPLLTDSNGSTVPASCTFYKRARALYDANFETDRVTVVQSLILIGWHWDGADHVVKNMYYWGRVAIIVAQDTGMHRSVQASRLSNADKKLWKRIWWTLVTRDRSIAVAFGRPLMINLDDCDVETLQHDDFIDEDEDYERFAVHTYTPDPVHVHFFLRYVELSKIMGRIQSSLYPTLPTGQQNMPEVLRIDRCLADWLQNCPDILLWPRHRQNFWASLIHLNYYTAVCMVHRFPLSTGSSETKLHNSRNHPSREMAFHAAAMISLIVKDLAEQDHLRHCPAYIVHTLFSAFVMHLYQMRSPELCVRRAAQDRLHSCMQVTRKISHVWLMGKMVYRVLEFVVDNRLFEEHFRKSKDV
ncbi:Transcriptional activator of fatty acid utilization [Metarhizium acridum]|nr:Transcriptional activator of fatty acid utilization [Metarhizium acridum]